MPTGFSLSGSGLKWFAMLTMLLDHIGAILLLDGTLPLTMGGGIGQSRLCMLLLGKAHIGEVQVSLWDDATSEICRKNQIELL